MATIFGGLHFGILFYLHLVSLVLDSIVLVVDLKSKVLLWSSFNLIHRICGLSVLWGWCIYW